MTREAANNLLEQAAAETDNWKAFTLSQAANSLLFALAIEDMRARDDRAGNFFRKVRDLVAEADAGTGSPVVEQPAPPVAEQPAPPVAEQPAPPVVEPPAPPVVEQPAPPVVEPSTPPVVEQPAPPVVEPPPAYPYGRP
jgi:outer membrane biosynthesis protein TonB